MLFDSESIAITPRWEFINKTIFEDYPNAWNDLNIINKMGYYGTNSVCLPRLFVTVCYATPNLG